MMTPTRGKKLSAIEIEAIGFAEFAKLYPSGVVSSELLERAHIFQGFGQNANTFRISFWLLDREEPYVLCEVAIDKWSGEATVQIAEDAKTVSTARVPKLGLNERLR